MDINRYSPRYGVNYRHMTKLADFSTEEIFEFLYAARAMKDKFIAHEDTKIFRDVTLALLFGDTSVYYYPISDEMKAKVAEMNAIPSVVERHDLVVELLNDMQVECPIVPLYDTVNYDVYTKGIEGYLPSSAGTYVYYLGKLTK